MFGNNMCTKSIGFNSVGNTHHIKVQADVSDKKCFIPRLKGKYEHLTYYLSNSIFFLNIVYQNERTYVWK